MRLFLAYVSLAVSAGGCSWIYNPDKITKPIDASLIDIEHVVDADPASLTVDDVFPKTIYEGAGLFNSRPGLLVIKGTNFIADATVTVTPQGPGVVTVQHVEVAADHVWIAVTLTADVDMTNDEAATSTPLLVTVTQGGGQFSKPLDSGKLPKLKFLDQIKTPVSAQADTTKLYSVIDVGGALTFMPSSTASHIVLHSMSKIAAGGITVNGGTQALGGIGTPGPGGCAGGAVGTPGAAMNAETFPCPGKGGAVVGGILGAGGGGAGYFMMGMNGGKDTLNGAGGVGGQMAGEAHIATFGDNVGAGGGGGDPVLGGGGPGGGGGGSLELDAEGDMMITAPVKALGGPGGGTSNGGGGGGAGGTVLVRVKGTLSITGGIDVSGGLGSTAGGAAGGNGSKGRTRVDAAHGDPPTGTQYIGPMFVDAPSWSHQMNIDLDLIGTQLEPMGDSQGRVFTDNGLINDSFEPSFGTDNGKGQSLAISNVKLHAGYNNVCVTVKGGITEAGNIATNCVEIAFLP